MSCLLQGNENGSCTYCMCVCSFCSRLASASEHLVSYLDRSDKQVVGTTYKDVHQLVDQVAESGFFDVVGRESAEPEAVASVTDPASVETDQPAEPESAPAGDGKSVVNCQSLLHCE